MDDDLEDIWNKYDIDGNGYANTLSDEHVRSDNTFEVCPSLVCCIIRVIDPTELRVLLEDISESKAGHRNVDDSTVQEVLERLDLNRDGVVQKEEFKHICAQSGIGAWYL
jgi:hypothetical protein